MIQRTSGKLHHGGGARKSSPRTAAVILWWSGMTTTLLLLVVLWTHLSIVRRYEHTISPSSSINTDDFVYNNSNTHSMMEQLTRADTNGERRRKSSSDVRTDNRPTGRFSHTWSFTSIQEQTVAPFAAVFEPTTWSELHGKKCQSSTYESLPSLQEYISSLDLYIVSHGGVGSNALIDHLDNHTLLKVKSGNDTALYYASCHLGNPAFVALVRQIQQQQRQQANLARKMPPTLVIVGDFWKAFSSMKRRLWLNMNIAKNLYGSQACRSKWENSLPIFPTDPAGIKMMMLAHIIAAQQEQQSLVDAAPIVFLQAPYTKESILQALQLLLSHTTGNDMTSVQRHLEGFQVRQRGTNTTAAAALTSSTSGEVDPLVALYKPYERLEEILSRMPGAWKASDTPRELYDYLLAEFQ